MRGRSFGRCRASEKARPGKAVCSDRGLPQRQQHRETLFGRQEKSGRMPALLRYSLLLYQINLRGLGAVQAAFLMCVIEDIDVISPNPAAPVLSGVDNSVDHEPGSVGDDAGIHSHSVPGGGQGSRTCQPPPSAGTAPAWALAGGREDAQRDEREGLVRL